MLKPVHPIDPETARQWAGLRLFARTQAQQAEAAREEPLRTTRLAAGGYDMLPAEQETRRAYLDGSTSAHEAGRRRDAAFLLAWRETLSPKAP